LARLDKPYRLDRLAAAIAAVMTPPPRRGPGDARRALAAARGG